MLRLNCETGKEGFMFRVVLKFFFKEKAIRNFQSVIH